VALGAQATSGPALASTIRSSSALPSSLQEFANCPVNNPKVNYCLAAASTGTFKINSTTLTETSPIKLILGSSAIATALTPSCCPTTAGRPWSPRDERAGRPPRHSRCFLAPSPSLPRPSSWAPDVQPLQPRDDQGTAISLPSDVLLGNALLGTTCTVGSPTAPTTLNLTDGKTHPPAPTSPSRAASAAASRSTSTAFSG